MVLPLFKTILFMSIPGVETSLESPAPAPILELNGTLALKPASVILLSASTDIKY